MIPTHQSSPQCLRGDNRAVSTTVNYVLNLAVATLLMSALLITGSGLVNDQRERVVRTELRVVGGQLADGIATTDRLANANGTQSVVIERNLPRKVASETYSITVYGSSDPYLLLSTSDPNVEVGVNLTLVEGDPGVSIPPGPMSLSGGSVAITYDRTTNKLKIAETTDG